MEPKLSVMVQVNLDAREVCIGVTGRVTGINQQGLQPLMARAQALAPDIRVVLDLSSAASVDPAALEVLRRCAGHTSGSAGPTQFRLPAGLTTSAPAVAA